MVKRSSRSWERRNLAARRGTILLAIIIIVGPVWAVEAAENQAGQQAAGKLDNNAATSSVVTWGKSEAGLQCSVNLQRPTFRVGDAIEVRIQIRNVSDEKLTFYYPSDYRASLLEIRDEKGMPVKKNRSAITEGWMHDKSFQTLEPADVFYASFIGISRFRLPRSKGAAPAHPALEIDFFPADGIRHELVSTGTFTISLHLTADEKTAALAAKQGIASLWQGDIYSNAVAFHMNAATRKELDAAIDDLYESMPAKKQQAIELLGAHVDGKAVPALVEILLKGPQEMRLSAEEALSAIQDRSIVPKLLAHYRNAISAEMRHSLLEVIQSSSDWPESWPLYLEIAQSNVSWEEKHHAISSLVGLRRPEVVPILVQLARSGDPIAQRASIDLMGNVMELGASKQTQESQFTKDVLTQLTDELLDILKKDKDATVRSRAASALRYAQVSAVVPALIDALKDGDPWVGSYAAHTLSRIAGPEAIPALEEYFAKVSHPSQKDAARKAIDTIRKRMK